MHDDTDYVDDYDFKYDYDDYDYDDYDYDDYDYND